jgi:5'-3' exonuclease
VAAADDRVTEVRICTPDKDLGQCVGGKVVQWDRRKDIVLDADAVTEKFGVPPASIPDYLALVGDSADGFPGIPGFGAKTAAAVLTRYRHIDQIPLDGTPWDVPGLRHQARLAAQLREDLELALLFRRIATCETDAPVGTVDDWRWLGPTGGFAAVCERLGAGGLTALAARVGAGR